MRPFVLLAALSALTAAAPAQAQGPDAAGFVTGLYRRYIGTDPDPAGLAFWVEKLGRGLPPSEVHANVIGSQQYFDQVGQNNAAFITRAVSEVAGRPPTPAEVDAQLRRLQRLGNDRVKWAREFLRGVGAALPPPPPAAADLPARLVTTCQLLAQAARSECPGPAGWLVVNQANNLVVAAVAGRPVLENPVANPAGAEQMLQNIEGGLGGLRNGLAAAGLPAPNTRLHADQAAEIVAAFRPGAGPGVPGQPPGQPAPFPPGGVLAGPDVQRLGPLARDLSRQTRQAVATVRAAARPDWASRRVLTELEQAAAGVDRVRADVRPGVPVANLHAQLGQVRAELAGVNQAVAAGTPDPRVRQSWYEMAASFDRLAAAAGLPPTGTPVPGGVAVPPQALAALDSAIAQADAAAAGFTPYQFYHPAVGRLQAELGDLRNKLARLRQMLTQNPPRQQVLAEVAAIGAEFRSAQSFHNQAVAGGRIPNAPSLDGLGNALAGFNAVLAQWN